jgi:hypothetical protein
MSRHIVFAEEDFEPITAVDIPLRLLQMAREGSCIQLAVTPPVPVEIICKKPSPDRIVEYIVTLKPVPFSKAWRGRDRFGAPRVDHNYGMAFVTPHDEMALLLDSVFLPGQYAELKKVEGMGATRGFSEAIRLFRRFGI